MSGNFRVVSLDLTVYGFARIGNAGAGMSKNVKYRFMELRL